MVTLGKDGVLREIVQVLNDQTFAKLQPGMTTDEVRRLIGRPAETMKFANLGEDVWSWKYETGPNEEWMHHVHFSLADGKLKRTSRSRVGTPP
jgi:outer membrane protein assembly factor BamE (lipoprotein component of BamABCDE complex)